MWDDWKRERRGFPPSFSASHCVLYASLSPLLGFVETQRDLCEEEKNAKLQVNALRKQSFEWVYCYSRTSWKRPPNGCQDLVVAYGRWSLTRIGQQKVSFENRPCTFWKKIRCMQIISLICCDVLHINWAARQIQWTRDKTIRQVVAYRRLKQRRIIELVSEVLTVAYEGVVVYERFEL